MQITFVYLKNNNNIFRVTQNNLNTIYSKTLKIKKTYTLCVLLTYSTILVENECNNVTNIIVFIIINDNK